MSYAFAVKREISFRCPKPGGAKASLLCCQETGENSASVQCVSTDSSTEDRRSLRPLHPRLASLPSGFGKSEEQTLTVAIMGGCTHQVIMASRSQASHPGRPIPEGTPTPAPPWSTS
jgi:hypothetical protein